MQILKLFKKYKTTLFILVVLALATELFFIFNKNVNTSVLPDTVSDINMDKQSEQVKKPEIKTFLYMDSEDQSLKVGDSSSFDIYVDSDSLIGGLDVLIHYPSDLVKIDKIKNTDNFDVYPLSKINTKDSMIEISALTNQNFKNGKVLVATVFYTTQKKGLADFKFDYISGSTTDSNVVLKDQTSDALSFVKDYSVSIN